MIRLFIDFGSTYTKIVALDIEKEELLGRVQVPSTVQTDITISLEQALEELAKTVVFGEAEVGQAVASSSAAGGLRVVCVGLVPEYTTEAARMAALGAGAKIVGTYSYEMSSEETAQISEIAPDIVLLTGGTDGGNKKVIIHNASVLAALPVPPKNIIVAGNKSAYDDIREILGSTGTNIIYTQNVMPEIGVLSVDLVNRQIRELFIARITEAKGIARVNSIIAGVCMPTPSAVMEAAKLIAAGYKGQIGYGELLLVDVGGATTDIYSISHGLPSRNGVSMIGLPQPYAKRTVEGDIGLFVNLDSLAEIAQCVGIPESMSAGTFNRSLTRLRGGDLPEEDDLTDCHLGLTQLAVRTAVDRHVGRIETVVTRNGDFYMQRGKDLTELKLVVGAGGPIAFSKNAHRVLSGALFQPEMPLILKPKAPSMMLDSHYILFAIGLLAQSEPAKALAIAKKYLVEL